MDSIAQCGRGYVAPIKGSIARRLVFVLNTVIFIAVMSLYVDHGGTRYYEWSDAPQWRQMPSSGGAELPACSGFLSAKSEGRLGNQMGEYASLYAHARRLGVKAVITEDMASFLAPIFPNISIPSEKNFPSCDFLGEYISKTDIAQVQTRDELFAKSITGNLVINMFPMEVPFFHPYRRELLDSEFAISPPLLERVQHFLHRVKRAKYPDLASERLLYVGVHVRRTDYKEFLRKNWGGHAVSKLFFTRAMETYRERYPRHKFLFLVVSDDLRWSKRMFLDVEDAVMAASAGPVLRGKHGSNASTHFDLALQASCNHSIMR